MDSFQIPDIPLRKLVLWTLAVAAVAGGFWLIYRFQNVLLLLAAGLILSTAIQPVVRRLEQRGVAKQTAVILVLAVVVLLLAVAIALVAPVLTEQGSALSVSAAEAYQSLRQTLEGAPNILLRRLLSALPESLDGTGPAAPDLPVSTEELELPETLARARFLVDGILEVIVIVLMAFSWTVEGERIKQALTVALPPKHRQQARLLVNEIESKLSGYLFGQGLLCLFIGALAFAAYMLIGLPNALLLALFAGLMEAVPLVGPLIGAVPAIIIGFAVSPATALWVILATVIIQQLENNVLVPRVMRKTIGVRPLVTLLVLLAFGTLFGILGALIALPLAAVFQLLIDRLLLSRNTAEELQSGRDKLNYLRYETNELVKDVRNQARNREGMPTPATETLEDELEALAMDLESFLAAQGNGRP